MTHRGHIRINARTPKVVKRNKDKSPASLPPSAKPFHPDKDEFSTPPFRWVKTAHARSTPPLDAGLKGS